MVLRSLFGRGDDARQPSSDDVALPTGSGDSQSIRNIAAEMKALPIEQRKHIAGFAYVLARVAHADLDISQAEMDYMERAVTDIGHLSEAQAVLVVEMARNMTELYGATDDFVATREFAESSTREQREDLLRTAFAVGAADDSITAVEVAELNEIGKELGFPSPEVDEIRDEFRDQLAAIQAMRAARGA